MNRTNLFAIVFFLSVALGAPSLADACPNCKDALEASRALAFAASIFLLMSMPFVIGSAWVLAILKSNGN